jgi:hypothetical protein
MRCRERAVNTDDDPSRDHNREHYDENSKKARGRWMSAPNRLA